MKYIALGVAVAILTGCGTSRRQQTFVSVKTALPASTPMPDSAQETSRPRGIWRRLPTGVPLRQLTFTDNVTLLCLSSNSVSPTKVVLQWWDVQKGQLKHQSAFCDLYPTSIAISPANQMCATAHENLVKLWDMQSGKNIKTLKTIAIDVGFSSDGRTLATWGERLSEDGEPVSNPSRRGVKDLAQLWRIPGFTLQRSLLKTVAPSGDSSALWDRNHIISDLNFMPDRKNIVLSTNREQTLLWNLKTGKLSRAAGSCNGYKLDFSPDGRKAVIEHDYVITSEHSVPVFGLCDMVTWQYRGDLWSKSQGPEDMLPMPITGMAFSPDSRKLAVAFQDHYVGLFDARTGKILKDLTITPPLSDAPIAYVGPLAFSPDGKLLACANDSQIEILKL